MLYHQPPWDLCTAGHYTAYVRDPAIPTSWLLKDDTIVSKTGLLEAISNSASESYILCYVRQPPTPLVPSVNFDASKASRLNCKTTNPAGTTTSARPPRRSRTRVDTSTAAQLKRKMAKQSQRRAQQRSASLESIKVTDSLSAEELDEFLLHYQGGFFLTSYSVP